MHCWSRNKGFWTGILENVRLDNSTYWVNASIIKINSQGGITNYGMISVPASQDEIEQTKKEYQILKNIKFDKKMGLTTLRYAIKNNFYY